MYSKVGFVGISCAANVHINVTRNIFAGKRSNFSGMIIAGKEE